MDIVLRRWSELVARRPVAVLLAGAAVTVAAAAYGLGVFGSLSQGGFETQGSESATELATEREIFGNRSVDVVAVYSSDDLRADQPGFRRAVGEVVRRLPDDAVARVVRYDQAPGLVSEDGQTAQVLISLAGSSQDDFLANFDRIEPLLEADRLRTQVAGTFAVYADVNRYTEADLQRAELLSAPLVVLLALLIFGSVVAASLPALVGALALVGSLAMLRLITTLTDVSVFAVNVVSLLGIGLAIDYGLFIVSRFREELAGLPAEDPEAVPTAIRTTMRTAGRTVLFSALTVAAAMASLLLFPQVFLKSMGYGGVAAVVVAMLAALTVLPATLRVLGRRVDAGRLPWRRGRPVLTSSEEGWWARLARAVMARPIPVVAGVVAGLLLLATPFLGVVYGNVDERVLPPSAPSRVATTTLVERFGPEQSSANLLLRDAPRGAASTYAASVRQVDGVVAVEQVARRGDATLLQAVWRGADQSEASQDLVRRIREVRPPQGSVLVGGLSAETVDLVTFIGDRLPWLALVIATVMLVLLFWAFGSVVLPVKAVAMNFVSIGASFGVVTWVFGDGHLSGLLDFTATGFVDPGNLLLIFAIIFGLSMDYEVFLLSRVREQWDRTGDNTRAVATGLQRTGRIITSAALLLAVVIGAFAISQVAFMKLIGLGMLVALLVDATVVRAVLVPATMRLLGRWNWWAPGPLRRLWGRYGFREADEAPGADLLPDRQPVAPSA